MATRDRRGACCQLRLFPLCSASRCWHRPCLSPRAPCSGGSLRGAPQGSGTRLALERGVQPCCCLHPGLPACTARSAPQLWVLIVPRRGQRVVPAHSLGVQQGAVLALSPCFGSRVPGQGESISTKRVRAGRGARRGSWDTQASARQAARPPVLPAELHVARCWGPCMAALAPGMLRPPPAPAGLGLGAASSGKHGWGGGAVGDRTGMGGGVSLRGAVCEVGRGAAVVRVLSLLYPSAEGGDTLGQAVPSCAPPAPCVPPTIREALAAFLTPPQPPPVA